MNLTFFKSNTPIVIYVTLYSLFTLVGISFFFLNNDLYLSLYEIFSGVSRPVLTLPEQYRNLFLISYISPLIFVVFIYLFSNMKYISKNNLSIPKFLSINTTACLICYFLVCSYLAFRILMFINLESIVYCYTNYKTMINARFFLFKNFNSFDWILFYSFVPLITGILYYKIKSQILRTLILLFSIFILSYTMQKRYILILFVFIFLINFFRANKLDRNFFLNSFFIGMVLIFTFYMQTYLPAAYLTVETIFSSPTSDESLLTKNKDKISKDNNLDINPIKQKNKETSTSHQKIITEEFVLSTMKANNLTATHLQRFHYLTAFLNRTSIPSIYYFELFPYKRDFLNFSFAHFLPMKEKDNEGKLMWGYLNGDFASAEGASVAAFNFSLYARVGVWGTLLISAFLGIFCGMCWSIIQSIENSLPKVIFSSIFCIFMIFMSMDNFRSSMFTAYGVFWWTIGYLIISFLSKLFIITENKFRNKEYSVA